MNTTPPVPSWVDVDALAPPDLRAEIAEVVAIGLRFFDPAGEFVRWAERASQAAANAEEILEAAGAYVAPDIVAAVKAVAELDVLEAMLDLIGADGLSCLSDAGYAHATSLITDRIARSSAS